MVTWQGLLTLSLFFLEGSEGVRDDAYYYNYEGSNRPSADHQQLQRAGKQRLHQRHLFSKPPPLFVGVAPPD